MPHRSQEAFNNIQNIARKQLLPPEAFLSLRFHGFLDSFRPSLCLRLCRAGCNEG
jgi:hypothetical protein